jgi:pimeloyl-ACP methyl ester carboxylesterase
MPVFPRWLRRTLITGATVLGSATLLLAGALAVPTSPPPEMRSVSDARRKVDFSALPDLARFQARDGTALAYRHYPPQGVPAGRIALVIHGSAGSSRGAIHALASAMSARGLDVVVPDIRGHGGSGPRGDIGYIGQLEDDVADLLTEIRKQKAAAPITLVGHSSGGGFALRVAASRLQNNFERTVLLAPYLGHDVPSSRKDAGGWANPDLPRFFAIMALNGIGIPCCQHLPTLAFATPPGSDAVAAQYSYRLMRNFGADIHFRTYLAQATRPLAVIAGADDEMMYSAKYREVMGERATVTVIDGVDHMGIVANPKATALIAADVAGYRRD